MQNLRLGQLLFWVWGKVDPGLCLGFRFCSPEYNSTCSSTFFIRENKANNHLIYISSSWRNSISFGYYELVWIFHQLEFIWISYAIPSPISTPKLQQIFVHNVNAIHIEYLQERDNILVISSLEIGRRILPSDIKSTFQKWGFNFNKLMSSYSELKIGWYHFRWQWPFQQVQNDLK